MSNIAIWNGTSTYTTGSTPFGFYDSDATFRSEADQVAKWCAQRLGYPLINVELQSGSFYTAFEEAITTYGNEVYQYKIRENYLSMEGNSTGSSFNNQVITPNLGRIIALSQTYGTEAGAGGKVTYYTGSLTLTEGVQDYDMNVWASGSGITSSIEIKRVFFENPPAIVRFFDPYAGTGTGMMQMLDSFGWGSYSPAINFMLMPISYDMQKIQAIELNDQIRKSQYTFELVNNMLRIFPIPKSGPQLLKFEYILLSDRNKMYVERNGQEFITNASNVPYENPTYLKINSIGRQWIFEYGLSIVKEILGYVRGKYSTIPIPGSEVTLNQGDLISAATSEKTALIERLRIYFESTSRKTLLENKSLEADFQNKTIAQVPMTIFIG